MRKLFATASIIAISLLIFASGSAQAATAKALITGLISMEDITCLDWGVGRTGTCTPDNSLSDIFGTPGVMDGVVINVTWAQLQPNPGTALSNAATDTSVIDETLALIQLYNASNPQRPLRATLRVESGAVAPNWIKTLDGGPVQIVRPSTGTLLAVPLFWTADYNTAWRALQARLAAKYDRNPLIAQVSNTSCSHESDQPYVNPLDSPSIVALFNAGYTNNAYIACLMNSAHDYDAWQYTNVDFCQNTFEQLSITSVKGALVGVYGPTNLAVSQMIMQYFRQVLQGRAIFSMHDLNYPANTNDLPLLGAIQSIGKPIQFQTTPPGIPGGNGLPATGSFKDWPDSMTEAVGYGASAVEVWPSNTMGTLPHQDGWNRVLCIYPAQCAGQPTTALLRYDQMLTTQVASRLVWLGRRSSSQSR